MLYRQSESNLKRLLGCEVVEDLASCTNPIRIWKVNGEFTFQPVQGLKPLLIPCRICYACRENYKKELLIRALHEYEFCEEAMFLTLTVSEENMEKIFPDRSLSHVPFQKFMKRLRKEIYPRKIRYLMCGEYGEMGNRPHFHVIIFDFKFNDMYLFKNGKNNLYRSNILERLWPYGFSSIGDFTAGGASYLAKYVVKSRGNASAFNKITLDGVLKKEPYIQFPRSKEFGGLGYRYFLAHKKEIFERGYCLLKNNVKIPIPLYYKRKLRESLVFEDKKLYEYYLKNVIKNNEDDIYLRENRHVIGLKKERESTVWKRYISPYTKGDDCYEICE